MKTVFLCASIAATLAITSHLQAQTESLPETENNRATFAALERSVSIDFHETEFSEVVEFLESDTGLRFWLHESARDNDLDANSIFSVQLSNTRLATVLDLMLEAYECTYTVQDGIVKILSDEGALDQLDTQVIDCRKLLKQIGPKTVKRYPNDPRSSGGFGGGRRGGGAFAIPSRALAQDAAATEQQAVQNSETQAAQENSKATQTNPQREVYIEEVSAAEQLREVIIETIDPDSWEENGGTGRLIEINGMLVVVQTAKNLRRIKRLLKNLDVGDN